MPRHGEVTWTIEKIKEGFDKFFKKFGRYPTVLEIDSFESLPSSRQLQRIYPGGVRQLRQELGLEITDFTKGKTRSKTAADIGERGRNKEIEVQKILVDYFGEVFVHEQKPFDNYNGRFDFFVYAKNKKFAVDVFFPANNHSFTRCINIKQNIYNKNYGFDIILLQMNNNIFQEYMDKFSRNKDNPLAGNIRLMSLYNFLEYIKTIEPLKI